MGGRADERVAQRPQEACLVHGARGEGDRLLGGVLGGGHNRKEDNPRRLETLPLGGATIPPTMTPIDGSSKVVPELEGRQIAPYYQPAREVGGDFYDLFELEDAAGCSIRSSTS